MSADQARRVAVLIASDRLGSGPEELGGILIRSFVKTLRDADRAPWRLILINTGIRLALDGSLLLDDLAALEKRGVEVLACGTCLDYFQARERLRAGRVSNMGEIVATLLEAESVVRP